jgi:SNF family Na+-dependent transporter
MSMAIEPVVDGTKSIGDHLSAGGAKDKLRRVLASPIAGFAPWIAFSVLEGPKRYELAIGAALGIAVLELVVGMVVGARPKQLDIAAIVFFVGMLIAGVLVGPEGQTWLDRWSGEVSNAMLVFVALGSIAFRVPFTIQYAREMTPHEYWDTPLFLHINYVLTWVWTVTFAVTAIVGWYGDGPLNQPDNIWTNWIIQIALLIFAIRFTDWYPDAAAAHALPTSECSGENAPGSIASLFLPLAGYLVPIGIVLLVLGASPTWCGVGLIAIGALLVGFLQKETPPKSSSNDSVVLPGSAPA